MLWAGRQYQITTVATADELAELLLNRMWPVEMGVRFGGRLYLNTFVNQDQRQDYDVVDERKLELVDSIAISKEMSREWLRDIAQRLVADTDDDEVA